MSDTMPPEFDGFESVASAADVEMDEILIADYMHGQDRYAVAQVNALCAS